MESGRPYASLVACALLLALVASPGAFAEEPPRLYTNADLERFPALPDSTVSSDSPSTEEWRFVVDYLDRQYDRIDRDRGFDLSRQRTEAEVEFIQSRSQRRGAYLPLNYGIWGGGIIAPFDERGSVSNVRRAVAARGRFEIRPQHARPTQAQIMRHRATRRSGVAAFPSNARRSGR